MCLLHIKSLVEGGGGGELNLQLAQRAGVGAQGEVLLRVGSRAAGRTRGGRHRGLEERRRGGGEEEGGSREAPCQAA